MQAALSPHVAEAHGIDISPKMVEAARRRCAGLPNVFFSVTSGRDLGGLPGGALRPRLRGRLLPLCPPGRSGDRRDPLPRGGAGPAPGGEFVILHFSYRDSTEADRAEVRKLCRAAGFMVVMNGAQPFKLWDGVAFRMRKG